MNPDHLKLLQQGFDAWFEWRAKEPSVRPDLSGAKLRKANLKGAYLWRANLGGANLSRANLSRANLIDADLSGTDLRGADLSGADLSEANLRGAKLMGANLDRAVFRVADLSDADLSGVDLRAAYFGGAKFINANLFNARGGDLMDRSRAANFYKADLSGANLYKVDLAGADLRGADLRGGAPNGDLSAADLTGADLREGEFVQTDFSEANLTEAKLTNAWLTEANLNRANLNGATLSGATLTGVNLVEADLTGADLTGCRIYGISAWGLKLDQHTKQQNLIITPGNEPEITVDNIEVAQFVYLLLHNEKIRDAVDTIGKKGVLLLGRFTGGRMAILERLREELRNRDFLPLVFNFDKPKTKDFTETVRLLAGMSRFVIVDITNPRSAPLELQATVPEYMIPFVPILERGEEPFAMFKDLWIKHRQWVLDPIRYPSVDRLIDALDTEIIAPAQARFAELLALKAEELQIKDV